MINSEEKGKINDIAGVYEGIASRLEYLDKRVLSAVISATAETYIMFVQEQGKDKRTPHFQEKKSFSSQNSGFKKPQEEDVSIPEMATIKQQDYLKSLGFSGDVTKLSKYDARAAIEALKNEKK